MGVVLAGTLLTLAACSATVPPPSASLRPPRPATASTPSVAVLGLHAEYRAISPSGGDLSPEHVEAAASIIAERLATLGARDHVVWVEGADRILVEAPNAIDERAARRALSARGRIELAAVPRSAQPPAPGEPLDPATPALLDDARIISAAVGTDQFGEPAVDFELDAEGWRLFGRYTGANIGEYFVVAVDGTVLSAPRIQSRIDRGPGQIAGSFEPWEARALAAIAAHGRLPVAVEEVTFRGPT